MSCPASSISHSPAQRLACVHLWRVLSERVPRDSQTPALSCSVRSTSDFAGTVPAKNTCSAPVAAHNHMTACLCVSLFIGRGVLDENACSCVVQCKAFRPAQSRAVWVAQKHAHACLLCSHGRAPTEARLFSTLYFGSCLTLLVRGGVCRNSTATLLTWRTWPIPFLE